MTRRGKVLRDSCSGPGLVIVEGRQFPFVDALWTSQVRPKPGLPVDLELDAQGRVSVITPVSDSQLAKEQADFARGESKKTCLGRFTKLAGVGMLKLAAAGLLVTSWFLLPAMSLQIPLLGRLQFTFWQLLGCLHASNLSQLFEAPTSSGAGVYGFLAICVSAGPFLREVCDDKRAALAGLLPLAFVTAVAMLVGNHIQSLVVSAGDRALAIAIKEVQQQAMSAISLAPGAYVSILVCLYFAVLSCAHFVSRERDQSTQLRETKSAAAQARIRL